MLSLEQVKLLESRVSKTIDHVKKVTGENLQLKEKLSSYQNRIEELEALIQQFKENQSRIEDGIISALDRLNQFEDALEGKLSSESKPSAESKPQPANKAAQAKNEEKAPDIIEELSSPTELGSEEPSFGEQSSPELDIF